MKRNRLFRPTHSAVSSPINLLSNAFAGLSRTLLFALLAAMAAAWSTPAARAQSVTFAYAQTTVGSSFVETFNLGLAVDGSGNVYADEFSNSVEEILAVNGSIPLHNPTIKTLASSFAFADGLAVDGNGNVYVADDLNNAVYEILAVNGSIPTDPAIKTLSSHFDHPQGVAVDGKGDVYVADQRLYEIMAVNGSIPADPTINILASFSSAPEGSMALDRSGNVFVAEPFIHAVEEIPADNSANRFFESGFGDPTGVAVNTRGNFYVADASPPNNSFVHGGVEEFLAGSGNASNGGFSLTPIILGRGLFPVAVAVDGKGDVFVTPSVDPVVSPIITLRELQLQSVNFGSANVCPAGQTTPAPCSNTITLTYNVAAGTTIGGVNILTAGAKDLDFQAEANDTSTTLCSTQTYSSPTTCTVNVTFAPLAHGLRNGTVQIVDGGSNILATTPIYGTVHHATQTIDFPTIEPQTALTPLDHLYATASSGLPVRFASNTPTVCTVSGIRVNFLTSGSCNIIATEAGNVGYFAAITGQTFLVHHRRQVITFDAIAAQPVNTMLTLTATTDSELPITYATTTPTICTVSGSTASLVNTGTCTIQASQGGNATWFPSGPKTQSFTVE